MMWDVTFLPIPENRAMLSCQAQPERGFAVAAGAGGVTARIQGDEARASIVSGSPNLSAAALDVLDRQWVAAAGRLWVKEPAGDEWRSVWEDARWKAPFVGLMADVGLVVAMTVDGAVLEGRTRAPAGSGKQPGPVSG